MGRKVDLDDLVGSAEIAERLGLRQTETVHSWRRRYPDFPQPVASVSQVMVWLWSDVSAWAQRTGRLRPDT